MANKNFVVHNGLTVGPLTIFAANGSITTTGTVGGSFTANAATLTGTTLNATVVASSLTSVGNITTGTWSGSVIQPAYIATLNQNTTGSAASLTTSRNINGVAFNGTADITVTANAATLTGTTLNSSVVASSLTSVGTLGSLTVTGAATVGSVVAGNISINATADAITSSGTLTLDPNPTGSGGLVVIQGNLQVTGTTTTVNSTTVEVADLNITLAKDAATAAAANGAGLTVAGASATFNYASTGDKWASNKPLDVTGNMTVSGAITVNSGNNVTAIVNGGTSGTGNIGASGQTFNTIFAKATTAQYADLAEKYAADAEYEPGTVLCFGGSAEVTECDHDADRKVAGVVTTNPAYMMNDAIAAEHSAAIALQGRVPCKVVGPVALGDMLVSAGAGRARAEADPKVGSVIGKALEAHAEGEGVIEVAVGRF